MFEVKYLRTLTILETAKSPIGIVSVISNVALSIGSSQQGKQRLASIGANCVTAPCTGFPSTL